MKKFILLTLPCFIFASYNAQINPITPNIKERMIKGNSYRAGCPVSLNSLRYITLTYVGFDGKEHRGELIVNKAVAKDIVSIFKELYNIKYPIKKMRLVSDYHGSDFASIEADNTSAFNCRFVDGTHKWSNHSYGRAIDINPIENPYVSKRGDISHSKSLKYGARERLSNSADWRAVILKRDKIVNIFKKYGWRWGGSWHCCKDYQHFDKKK